MPYDGNRVKESLCNFTPGMCPLVPDLYCYCIFVTLSSLFPVSFFRVSSECVLVCEKKSSLNVVQSLYAKY